MGIGIDSDGNGKVDSVDTSKPPDGVPDQEIQGNIDLERILKMRLVELQIMFDMIAQNSKRSEARDIVDALIKRMNNLSGGYNVMTRLDEKLFEQTVPEGEGVTGWYNPITEDIFITKGVLRDSVFEPNPAAAWQALVHELLHADRRGFGGTCFGHPESFKKAEALVTNHPLYGFQYAK